MVLVLGGAHTRTHRVAFAHIGTVLSVTVPMRATIVVDAGFLVEPHHGSTRTVRNCLGFCCVFAHSRGVTRQARLARTMEAVERLGRQEPSDFCVARLVLGIVWLALFDEVEL